MTREASVRQGLVLVGVRATGKSTAGRLLAERLGWSFVDTDPMIERACGLPIREIFARWGENRFRDLESEVLQRALQSPEQILATGGGIVLREANRQALRAYGFVTWLTADPPVLARRLEADPKALCDRPALTHAGTLDEIATVLEARTPLYREVADAIIDTTDRTVPQVVEAVMAAWPREDRTGGARL